VPCCNTVFVIFINDACKMLRSTKGLLKICNIKIISFSVLVHFVLRETQVKNSTLLNT
jgi:hypothetical protein